MNLYLTSIRRKQGDRSFAPGIPSPIQSCRCRLPLAGKPFVLAAKERGRMLVKAASRDAQKLGIEASMVLADALAFQPDIQVLDYNPTRQRSYLPP